MFHVSKQDVWSWYFFGGLQSEFFSISFHFLTRYDFDVSLLGEAHEWNQRRGNYSIQQK